MIVDDIICEDLVGFFVVDVVIWVISFRRGLYVFGMCLGENLIFDVFV